MLDQKKKEEDEQRVKEKAEDDAQKRQLIVSLGYLQCSQKLTGFQMLQKWKDMCKAQEESGVARVSTGNFFLGFWN